MHEETPFNEVCRILLLCNDELVKAVKDKNPALEYLCRVMLDRLVHVLKLMWKKKEAR